MGNAPSNRRNGRIQHNPVAPPSLPTRVVPPPSGYPGNHAPYPPPAPYVPNGQQGPYYYPPNYNAIMGSQYYQSSDYSPSNGHYMMNQGFRNSLPLPTQQAPSPIAETQKANTIRNDVNVNKSSLRLEKDEENPGFHLVAFSFDATVAGSVTIFFLAREIEQCGFAPLNSQVYNVTRVPFEKGLCQKFRQAPGTGVNLSMFDERDLCKEGDDDVYPLVVRTETVAKDAPAGVSLQSTRIDAPLPKWIHCQTTHGVIERKEDGNVHVRVVRQNIWIDGTKYELKEIYGIEVHGGGGTFESGDDGKECVICMSEPRDTFVLPCRHMCMCKECADVLKSQTNRCPICRTPVEKLFQINVSTMEHTDEMANVETWLNAGQSSSSGSGGASQLANVKGSSG